MIFETEEEQKKINTQPSVATADMLNRRQNKEDSAEHNDIISSDDAPFLSPSWEHYLDLLQDLCHHRNVLVAVTAPAGAGKTTLMCQFIEIIHDGDLTHSLTHSAALSGNLHICTSTEAQTCQVFAHTDLDKPHLLTLITEGFNLPPAEGNTLDEKLQFQIMSLQESPHLCLLLIDNAENLPAETIATLLTLIQQQSSTQMNFHVILLGAPALQSTLNLLMQDEANTGALLLLPLAPFSLEETKHYIEQQLENNVLVTNAVLTTPIVETIYKLSEGIPARINKIAQRLLVASEQQKSGTTMNYFEKIRTNQTKLIGGLLILSLIAISSYFLNKKDAAITPIAAVDILNGAETATNVPPLNPPQPTQAVAPDVIPLIPPTTVTTKQVNTPAAITPAAQPLNAAPSLTAPTVSAATPVQITKPVAAATVSSTTAMTTHTEQHFTYTADEKRLLGVGPANYTIQLFAGHNSKEVIQFIKQHHLGPKVHYFRAYKQHQPSVILVSGTYSSFDAAKGEIENLPADLQKLKPWAKNYETIHEEIHAARDHALTPN